MSLLFADQRTPAKVPARHRKPGLPSMRNPDAIYPWWSMPTIVGMLVCAIMLAVWLGMNPTRWVAASPETPRTQGVVLAATAKPTHPWFGITMQCWNEKHQFVIQYEAETPGEVGWEQAAPIKVTVEIQEREGDSWYTLGTTTASDGALVVSSASTRKWLTPKRAQVVRLVAADKYTSVTRRIGYQNTCSGGE